MDITKFYDRRSSETVLVNDSSESESESQHTVKTVRKTGYVPEMLQQEA